MSKDTPDTMPGEDDGLSLVTDKLTSLLDGPEPQDEDEQPQDAPEDVPSEDDAPEQASEENEGDEPAKPAIEPPSSWDSAKKAEFAKLPANLQEYISTRERERETAIGQKLQQTAEERKAVLAQQAETTAMRNAYEQRLMTFARHLETTIPEEFRDIRSNADLVKLADTNPALVTKFHAWQAQVSSVAQELSQIQQQKEYEAQVARSHLVREEFEKLATAWPDFVDQQKGSSIKAEISAYAKQRGFSDEEIGTLADHRLVLVLRDALAGQKARSSLENAQKKVAAKPLPKVVRPGSGEQTSRKGVDRAQATKVARNGDRASIQQTLERLLSS